MNFQNIPNEITLNIASYFDDYELEEMVTHDCGTAIFYRALCDPRYPMNRIVPYDSSLAYMDITRNHFIVKIQLGEIQDLPCLSDAIKYFDTIKYIIVLYSCNLETVHNIINCPHYAYIVKNCQKFDFEEDDCVSFDDEFTSYKDIIPKNIRIPIYGHKFMCNTIAEYNAVINDCPKWFPQVVITLENIDTLTIEYNDIRILNLIKCKNIIVATQIPQIKTDECSNVTIHYPERATFNMTDNIIIPDHHRDHIASWITLDNCNDAAIEQPVNTLFAFYCNNATMKKVFELYVTKCSNINAT